MIEVAHAPTVQEFEHEALAFLQANARPREERSRSWGEGSDSMDLLDEVAAGSVEVAAAKDWQRLKFESGFGWIDGPPRYGGRGLALSHVMRYQQLEARFDVPDPALLSVGLGMVLPTVAAWAQPDLAREIATRLASAELVACQLFSEPNAGSDLANIATRAELDGDEWVISGQKVWTSSAHYADIGMALVATEADAPKHRNLSMLLLDMDTPGVTVRPIRQMTGGASFNEVFFDDVRVPAGRLLGARGEGWRVAVSTLMNERSSIGSGRSGGIVDLRLLFELVNRYAPQRQSVRMLAVDAYITQWLLAQMGARGAAELAAGAEPGPKFSIGKVLLAENLRTIARCAGEALGPALVADTEQWGTFSWNSVLLSVPAYSVGGGSDEIQRNILAERCLGLPRDPRSE